MSNLQNEIESIDISQSLFLQMPEFAALNLEVKINFVALSKTQKPKLEVLPADIPIVSPKTMPKWTPQNHQVRLPK